MVAIKQLSAIPIVLALSSAVVASDVSGDIVARDENVDLGVRVNDGGDIAPDLEARGAGMSKPKTEKPKLKISNPKLIGGTNPIAMNGNALKPANHRSSTVSTTSSNGDPFYLEKYVKKGKRDEEIYERDEDDLFERDEDDELFERDFEDDLYERDFVDELYERYFEDDLYERDFDDELFEREFEDGLYARGAGMSKPKTEKPKPKISNPTLIGGTHPITMPL